MQHENLNVALHGLRENNKELEEKWLTFWLDGQLFAASIANVEQIVSMQPITQIPESPSHAKGVFNLRGNIIPAFDLRLRLGKSEKLCDDHTCIIINNVGEVQIGFIVDEVDAVIDIPLESISPPPSMGGDSVNRYLIGIARIVSENGKENIVLCLDAGKVLLGDEMEHLSEVTSNLSAANYNLQ